MNGPDDSNVISLPYVATHGTQRIELVEATDCEITGAYVDEKTHNRFEVTIGYTDGTSEWFSVLANQPYSGRNSQLANSNCSFSFTLEKSYETIAFEFRTAPSLNFSLTQPGKSGVESHNLIQTEPDTFLFDVSDLVYYIGHHDNLTGIQRVQACVLLGLIAACPHQPRKYISFNNQINEFIIIDRAYFEALLIDLSLPLASRKIKYDRDNARLGILPNAEPIATELISDQRPRLIVFLLGAAWVNRDYFHRILELKRTYNAYFCMTIHDLIPIFARETCDQGTATVFEEFLRKSFMFTDHYFAVSEYTCFDMLRFAASIGHRNVPVSVLENGHSFDECFPSLGKLARPPIKSEYVLFVSTIEGRKNHSYIFDVWAKLDKIVPNLPTLVCVGRLGWRAESFLERMLVTGNLGNKIRVMSDVSDAQLEALYQNSLFTVYPSIYEGWGLPVGESLSKGKLCVHSDRSSIPEVSTSFGISIDVDSVDDGVKTIRRLIEDKPYRNELELRLKSGFKPRSWKEVARSLVAAIGRLPSRRSEMLPIVHLGMEYKLAQLPPRNISALGYDMISQVEGARKALITGSINRDEDLLSAQAMRCGPNWCSPEDWGTWSRFPECEKLFYLDSDSNIDEIVIYEKLRVVGPMVGHTLRVSINDGVTQDFPVDDVQLLLRISGPVRREPNGLAEVRIKYHLRGTSDITAELDKIDGRRLGLGFESTLIVDFSDIHARVAMLERMLFGGAAGRPRVGNSALVSRTDHEASRSVGRTGNRATFFKRSGADLRIVGSGDQRSLNARTVEVGQTISLSLDDFTGSPAAFLGRGWFPLESSGVWTNGNEGTLHFRFKPGTEPAFILSLEMRCLADRDREVIVSVAINNTILGSELFRDSEFKLIRYVVDTAIFPDDAAFVVLLRCDRTTSPAAIGIDSDSRDLGIQLRTFSLKPMPTILLNKKYEIHAASEMIDALSSGWYPVEDAGVWSKDEGGRIVGAVNVPTTEDCKNIRISISGRIFAAEQSSTAKVDLIVDGGISTTWEFENGFTTVKSAVVPLLRLGGRSLLDVRIMRRGIVPSPADLGFSDDRRKLGLMISDIEFAAVDLFKANQDFMTET